MDEIKESIEQVGNCGCVGLSYCDHSEPPSTDQIKGVLYMLVNEIESLRKQLDELHASKK
jgi:hypothetical protein